jgi:hypothetical protein
MRTPQVSSTPTNERPSIRTSGQKSFAAGSSICAGLSRVATP